MLFTPLGNKLKETTGHDVINIDVESIAGELKTPAIFLVTEDDAVSGKADVISIHDKYGCSAM